MAWRWPWQKREEERDYTLAQLLSDTAVPTYSGMSVTPDSALRSSAVWSCVNLIASTICVLPVDAYRVGDRKPIEPLPRILVQPSADLEFHDWCYAVVASLLTRGNAYGLITGRFANLRPSQVDLVNADHMDVRQTTDSRVEYRINGEKQDPSDVWHVRAYCMPGEIKGLSPVEYARQSIGLGLAQEKFGADFFGSGGVPTGVIAFPEDVDYEAGKKFQQAWDEALSFEPGRSGRQGRHKTGFIGGGAKYQQVSVSNEDSQFVESRKAHVADIARIFNVPPELVASDAGSSLTYANIAERSLHFLLYCINPWLVRLDKALSRLLPANQFVKLNPNALLRATTRQRYEVYEIALRNKILTVEEVRALEDLPTTTPSSNGSRLEPFVLE